MLLNTGVIVCTGHTDYIFHLPYCTFPIVCLGLCEGTKCVQGLPQRPRENSWDAGPRWLAAHRRHREVVTCTYTQLRRLVIISYCRTRGIANALCVPLVSPPPLVSFLSPCRTARWRSSTGRSISSSWRRASTSPPRRLRTSTLGVNLWPSFMCMETVCRWVGCRVGLLLWTRHAHWARTNITNGPILSWVTTFSDDFSTNICSSQSCLVGIVVPDHEVMPEWAKKKGILGTYKDLCKNTVGDTWL